MGLIEQHSVDEGRKVFLDFMAEIDADMILNGEAAALFDTFAGPPQ